MKKIRWGIVGPGNIANKFARAIKNVEQAELVAVAARNEEKGRAFAEKYGIPHVFCGYEAMAAFDGIDAVYVSTPHPFHKPCAELFLRAGKHVLSEKPVCINAWQAEQLKKCAEENNVFLMEAMWTRFLPAVQEAKAIVERGDIGTVLGIEADFCYNQPMEDEPKIYQNNMAGGSLLDVGVYGLHFAAVFQGSDPESVTAAAQVENGVDCHTNVLLKYSSGAVATISSAINLQKPETAYIYGTKGYIYLPCFYGAQELFVRIGEEETHISRPSIGEGFEEEIIEACRCIQAGKQQSEVLPMQESIAILTQMDKVRKMIGLRYPFEGERV